MLFVLQKRNFCSIIILTNESGANNMDNRLYERRKELGLTLEEVGNIVGVSKSTVKKWESGYIENMKRDKIALLAKALKVSPLYIMGIDCSPEQSNNNDYTHFQIESNQPARKKGITINVLGRVAAGIPIEAIENIIDTEEIPAELAATGTFFGLKIKGDSMIPNICNGDIVIVRQQDDAESGDIVIATVNGTDATCKRLRKYKDGIELISNNPSYDPMEFSNRDIMEKPVRIIGKVVELRRKF